MNTFCTSIHCMDGRIQETIINFLKEHYAIKYVDTITEAGPCKILAGNKNEILVNSIIERIDISVGHHKSALIAISGHHDCAGNPCDKDTQIIQIKQSVQFLKDIHPNVEIIGLWVDNKWKVNNV